MRLLNCRTKTLDEFAGSTPQYAILSHTWDVDEVVFDNLNERNTDHTTMKGWYKIQRSCEQALQDGLEYLWTDTVCINKSSSTELSEAINSMFNWYRDSTVCYAYLCDLPAVALDDSRWFSRGWTLQELIAPRELKFYDKDWTFKGSKIDFLDQLHRITGIDPMALQGGNLRLISVARKMSWASNRQTTRPEDIAYSLLGLFGISMPMLYGEGSRAFIRLQEEIVKEYDDETLFAWRSSTAVKYTGLFAQSPADFALSGNIFPCQSQWSISRQIEPVSVSSRGLRITASLQKMEQFADPTFLVRLNCKQVHFDRKPKERVGIVVAKRFGVGDVYARIMPNDLPTFQPGVKQEVETLFALKESHTKEFGLMEYCGFWIRTTPLWPARQIYYLAFAHPSEFWDHRNNMFRRSWLDEDKRPFVLVFRKAAGADKTQHSYFIVFLGVEELSQLTGNWSRNQMWCSVKFCHASELKTEDLDREVKNSDREDMIAHIRGRGDRFAQDEGEGVTLKCYTQLEVVDGQHLFCADLHIKAAQDSDITDI